MTITDDDATAVVHQYYGGDGTNRSLPPELTSSYQDRPKPTCRAPTTAGSLTSPTGAVAGFSRAFVAAAIVAVLLAVVAFVKMPSTHVTGGGGNLHMR